MDRHVSSCHQPSLLPLYRWPALRATARETEGDIISFSRSCDAELRQTLAVGKGITARTSNFDCSSRSAGMRLRRRTLSRDEGQGIHPRSDLRWQSELGRRKRKEPRLKRPAQHCMMARIVIPQVRASISATILLVWTVLVIFY